MRSISALVALSFGLTFFASDALACFAPYSGPEYDSQINVEPIDGLKNAFRITAPAIMNDSTLKISILKYFPYVAPADGKQPHTEISLESKDGELVGEFSTPSREDAYEITVELWYFPETGGCPTGAAMVLDELIE